MRVLVSRLAFTTRQASWMSLAVLFAACNPDELTGPGDVPSIPVVDVRPLFSGFEGGSSIGIPGNNGPTSYGGVAWFNLFTVPKGHFFQIDVTGTISSTDSGNCNPSIGATGTWGPYGHNGSDGRVNFSTSPWQGGIPTSAPGSTMTLSNIYTSTDVTISVSRSIFWGTCDPNQTAGLNLSGGQTIEWKVAVPFEVSASQAVFTVGDSITFSASSEWTTTNNRWRWRANDTLATPLGSWPASEVCTSSATCKYAPTTSGRLYRIGTAPQPAGHELATPGPIVWKNSAPAFNLDLTSSAGGSSIVRGQSATFTVRNTGTGGELNAVDLDWRFEPDSVQFYPNSATRKFAPPIVYDTLSGDTLWTGTIVHPGKVIVTGLSGANSDADTFMVSVTDRSWAAPQVTVHMAQANTDRPDLPNPDSTKLVGAQFHFLLGEFFFGGGYTTGTVGSGPNTGYRYATSANYEMDRAYSINEWVDYPGYPNYDGGLTTWGYIVDEGFDPNDFRDKTIAHEIGAVANSHYGRSNTAGSSFPSCGHVNQAVERLVAGTTIGFNAMIELAWERAAISIIYLSDHPYVNGFQGPPNHVAEWRTGLRPDWLNGLQDDTTSSDNVAVPDSSYCDLTGV